MIKLVVCDMDGTFLTDQKTFDRAWFERIFRKLQDRKILFAIASGDQYEVLRRHLETWQDEITFIPENGALLIEKNQILESSPIANDLYLEAVQIVIDQPGITHLAIYCAETAYVPRYLYDKNIEGNWYYNYFTPKMTLIDNPAEVPEAPLKIALAAPESTIPDLEQKLKAKLGDKLRIVTSGAVFIDIIDADVSKGSTLTRFMAERSISADEMVCFGDSDNDVEMLALTPHSYAMANASTAVMKTARNRAPSNNDDGVFEVLDYLLADDE